MNNECVLSEWRRGFLLLSSGSGCFASNLTISDGVQVSLQKSHYTGRNFSSIKLNADFRTTSLCLDLYLRDVFAYFVNADYRNTVFDLKFPVNDQAIE